MKRLLVLFTTHAIALVIGFAAGIYLLPILIAPDAPLVTEVKALQGQAKYKTAFSRDIKGSDPLHWGEGSVSLDAKTITFVGKLAPGPDYKLYLLSGSAETKEEFLRVKAKAFRVGDVKTFENFVVPLPENVRLEDYNTVLVWCETFSMFITAAKYR